MELQDNPEKRPLSSLEIPLWRNRDYLLLLGGQAVSSVGTQLSQFAFPLLVLALSGSAAWAGITSALVAVPYLLLSLPAGALVDRWNRKRVLIFCDIGRALCLASIPVALLLGHLTLLQLCLAALVEGSLYVFFNVAEAAALPRVTWNERQLQTAASQSETTKNVAYTLGPALGGLLLGLGRALPFVVDACSYVVSVLSLLFITREFQEEREEHPRPLRIEIREGVTWLWRHRVLRFLAVLAGVGNGLDNAVLLLFLVIGTHQGASPWAIGVVYAVAGAGGIAAAFAADWAQRRFSMVTITLWAQWVSVLIFPVYLFEPSLLLLGVITCLLTAASTLQGVTQYGYRLSLIPDELQGRVNSVFRLVAFAGPPIFLAGTGLLLQAGGVLVAVLALWIILVAITACAAITLRHQESGGAVPVFSVQREAMEQMPPAPGNDTPIEKEF